MGQILNKITNFFQNFLKFEPILAQIWPNFEKSTHSYTRFCILSGVIHIPIYQEADFATHVSGTSPVLSTPPGSKLNKGAKLHWINGKNCICINKRKIAPSCAWVFSELAWLSALIKWYIDHRNIAIIPSDISFCKNGL